MVKSFYKANYQRHHSWLLFLMWSWLMGLIDLSFKVLLHSIGETSETSSAYLLFTYGSDDTTSHAHRFQPSESRNREIMDFGKIRRIQVKSGGTVSVIGSQGGIICHKKPLSYMRYREISGDIRWYREISGEYREKFCLSGRFFTSSGRSGVDPWNRESPDQIGRVGIYGS